MDPEIHKKVLSKSIEALKSGHRAYAVALLKSLLKESPDDISARKLLFKALQESTGVSRTNKLQSYFLKLKAEKVLSSGQTRRALELLQQALELNPLNVSIIVAITEILSTHNPQAVELLETIDVEHIQDINLLKRIARAYLNAKHLPMAKKVLKRILIVQPADLESQKMLKNLEALDVLEREFKSP